jgi:biotin carboxyl carrier protein
LKTPKIKEVFIVSEVKAPMGGKVIEVLVSPGDTVQEGEDVVIIEAMKMEMPIVSDEAGMVKDVICKQGDSVEADAVLVVLE